MARNRAYYVEGSDYVEGLRRGGYVEGSDPA